MSMHFKTVVNYVKNKPSKEEIEKDVPASTTEPKEPADSKEECEKKLAESEEIL